MVGAAWRRARETRVGGAPAPWLTGALALVSLGLGFLQLARDVADGETQQFDEWAVRSLRRADDPAIPVGPAWLREAGIDFTALGSIPVLLLFTAVSAGLLLLHGRRRLLWLLVFAVGGGLALNTALKEFFERRRPDVVPHLREVATPSFPSGHASLSAVVLLTLGVIAAGAVRTRRAKAYCVAVAVCLSGLVGLSRVYLGVHYPTDVLAGWAVGLGWALLCWLASAAARC